MSKVTGLQFKEFWLEMSIDNTSDVEMESTPFHSKILSIF